MASPQKTINNSSFLTLQKVDKTNYVSSILPNNPESTLFNEIVARTFLTTFYDSLSALSNSSGLEVFFQEALKYGKGKRIITVGLGNITDFSGSPDQRFPMSHNQLSDHEYVVSTLVRTMQRLTLKPAEWMRYFKDKEGLSEFEALYKKRFSDAWAAFYLTFFQRVFGAVQIGTKYSEVNQEDKKMGVIPFQKQPASVKSDKDVTEYPTIDLIATNLNKALGNNVKYVDEVINSTTKDPTNNSVNLIRALALIISQLKGGLTNEFNVGLDKNGQYVNVVSTTGELVDGSDPLYHAVDPNELIVVGSTWDLNEYERAYLTGVYNSANAMLPQVGRYIWLNIPPGNLYVLEKNALQINENQQYYSTDMYNMDLTMDLVGHQWFYVNFYPYAFGFRLSSDNPSTHVLAEKTSKEDSTQKGVNKL